MVSENGFDLLKQMPQNIDAEQALLSAILLNNHALERVSEFLTKDHFASSAHGEIYDACLKLIHMDQLADAITLKDYFTSNGKLEEIGGIDYLFKLSNAPISGASSYDYAKLIYDKAIRRMLIKFGQETIDEAFSVDLNLDGVKQIELAEQKLFNLSTSGLDETSLKSLGKSLVDTLQQTEYAIKADGNLSGVSTGFIDIDKKLGGLTASDLIIIAGRPGMGKSTLALNILFNVAKNVAAGKVMSGLNGPALFFSLEMSADQLASKILSSVSGVSSYDMRIGKVSTDDIEKLKGISQELDKLPIFIDDTPALSVSAIRTRARRLKMRYGGLSVIVIDYIQLLSPSPGAKKSDNRVVELSEMTRGLKLLANELNVPVIALYQLSRAVENRGTKARDKIPQLSDLRESGSIEQDADIVGFIYREGYYLEADLKNIEAKNYEAIQARYDKVKNIAEFIIAKHRHGATGIVELYFDGAHSDFRDLDSQHEEN